MKRFGIFILFAFLIIFAMSLMARATSVVGSKHDLHYSTGTGTYEAASPSSGGTTEVCVFCHTPHGGNTNAPLWNRKFVEPASGYTVYSSDVLSALSMTAEDPSGNSVHIQKTRICLTCHDGTTALGSVVNMPPNIDTMSYSEIQMSTAADLSDSSTQGYIGVELRDDHPVAIKYQQGTGAGNDPELNSGGPTSGTSVRLYKESGGKVVVDNTNGNYVECTSCHNVHDNQYGNFLVETNKQSALCKRCHNKTGFASSVHDNNSIANLTYQPTDGAGSNLADPGSKVGDVKCMNCHFPHKAAGTGTPPYLTPADLGANSKAGYYLLSFSEEKSCFNTNNDRWNTSGSSAVCHGTGVSGKRNIEDLVKESGGKSYRHPVMYGNYEGIHTATEARQWGWAGSAWHVECADCHNPHTAGDTVHTRGTNTLATTSVLYGAGGVSISGSYPGWPPPSTASGSYSAIQAAGVTNSSVTTVTYEYEICFKCHTDFAWGSNTPSTLTNQAMEFQPQSGYSFHPVIQSNPGTQGAGAYLSPWSSGSQTMYCSDCHNNDSARSPFGTGSDAAGPHGSTNPSILAYQYLNSYSTTTNGTADESNSNLCLKCHDPSVYNTYSTGDTTSGTGFMTTTTNLHNRHNTVARNAGSGFAYRCVNCHIKIPHGWYARKAMIIVNGDYATSTYAPQSPISGPTITGLNNGGNLPSSGGYGTTKGADCFTVSGCH